MYEGGKNRYVEHYGTIDSACPVGRVHTLMYMCM
jgi:hypothetical protein